MQTTYSKLNDRRLVGDLTLSDDLTVNDNLAVGGDAAVTGDLAVTGDAAVTGGLTVTGDLDVTGDFTFGGFLAEKVEKVALAAADTAGGLFAWQNPEAGAVIVSRIILDVTTQSSGACTADVGMTATNATTSADNLIDGVSLAAAGLKDNLGDAGTNGKAKQKVAAGKWVTGSVASGASAGLVGNAYIFYTSI